MFIYKPNGLKEFDIGSSNKHFTIGPELSEEEIFSFFPVAIVIRIILVNNLF